MSDFQATRDIPSRLPGIGRENMSVEILARPWASGCIGVTYGVNAMRRADGECVVLAAEDRYARQMLYSWKSSSCADPVHTVYGPCRQADGDMPMCLLKIREK